MLAHCAQIISILIQRRPVMRYRFHVHLALLSMFAGFAVRGPAQLRQRVAAPRPHYLVATTGMGGSCLYAIVRAGTTDPV